ncbi:unnamed protein product [Pleuronectes platessa]|uniref:Uncharacterized protein n=1 Tax=Pleuronectes platessa TaxID=8262 RepID=A0A9N7VSY2_PLEPL|nr:unnamed protein product [Pleuronectes platessa]
MNDEDDDGDDDDSSRKSHLVFAYRSRGVSKQDTYKQLTNTCGPGCVPHPRTTAAPRDLKTQPPLNMKTLPCLPVEVAVRRRGQASVPAGGARRKRRGRCGCGCSDSILQPWSPEMK